MVLPGHPLCCYASWLAIFGTKTGYGATTRYATTPYAAWYLRRLTIRYGATGQPRHCYASSYALCYVRY
eukprot:3066063-Rhodomonas_salina.5